MLNYMFSPDQQDDFYYSPYHDRLRYEQMRRQQEMEAARRRRAEFERYQQMRQLEEQKRRYEAAMRMKQHEQKKQERMDEKRRQQNEQGVWQIVRGPDGRLYRVPKRNEKSQTQQREQTNAKRFSMKGGRDENEVSMDQDKNTTTTTTTTTTTNTSSSSSSIETAAASIKSEKGFSMRKNARRQAGDVVVEDVSDDEDEDDFKSVWRNRLPSPGQWMEPVEGGTH